MLYLLTQAVDRAASRISDHAAIRFNGQTLTWADLAMTSDQLSSVLASGGVRRGDRVGIFMPKRLETAIAIHGIMKAGAAYVPLDPTAPAARVSFILRDCGIRHVITDSGRLPVLCEAVADGVRLDQLIGVEPADGLPAAVSWSDVATAPASPAQPGTMEQDLAYVLYTSGSTGVPKGVMHTHRSALSFAEIAVRAYGLHANDRLSNHAPLHFDLSTLDYFGAAVAGATTIVIPESCTKLPASLSKLMETERLTVLYAVPFALIQLLLHGALDKRSLPELRWVLFGGEPFPPKHLRALMAMLPQASFVNVYGPTEVNGVTHYPIPAIPAEGDTPIPIGKPYGNVESLIMDENDRPVPRGEPGLLLVRTPTMMRGYWGRADLNARAFYSRPAFGLYEDVFHRTGDLVRERPDGELEFLGRKDRQIKARGYRVELDEIEAALLTHAAVEGAAAFALPNGEGTQRIEAAVTIREGHAADVSELARHAAAHLPSYARPERIAILTAFPRTSTDKIDRLRLQAMAAGDAA
jgi:amino acid adenylation domain-containing protein